jgi:hypothetical protein
MTPAARDVDVGGMRPLAHAVTELGIAGTALVASGIGLAGAGGAGDDPRAAGLALAGTVLALWVLGAAVAVRRAIRLALPVRPRWSLEPTGTTVLRVLATGALPPVAVAVAAATVGAGRAPWAPAAAAGAVGGLGVVALLAAGRLRRAERVLGRRLLRQPGWGSPIGRRSLHLEPESLAERPGGAGATPWPAHRPPPRAQGAAMELEPANPPARHPVGVALRTARARRPQPPGGGSSAEG